jgi:hypothetical protein
VPRFPGARSFLCPERQIHPSYRNPVIWYFERESRKNMSKKGRTKRIKVSIADKYRQILEIPDLTDREIEQMRQHVGLLARTICEHLWKKKFY